MQMDNLTNPKNIGLRWFYMRRRGLPKLWCVKLNGFGPCQQKICDLDAGEEDYGKRHTLGSWWSSIGCLGWIAVVWEDSGASYEGFWNCQNDNSEDGLGVHPFVKIEVPISSIWLMKICRLELVPRRGYARAFCDIPQPEEDLDSQDRVNGALDGTQLREAVT